jgi:hypothetical protein
MERIEDIGGVTSSYDADFYAARRDGSFKWRA